MSDVTQTPPPGRDASVRVRVEFGRTHLRLDELARLSPGDVVALSCGADDAVDVMALGSPAPRLLARGELIEIGGKLGVRVKSLPGSQT